MRLLLMNSFLTAAASLLLAGAATAAPIKVLLVDGQNNHDWKATSPVLKKILGDAGIFTVETATAPPAGGGITTFKPDFAAYQVVVSNYNGEPWSPETKAAFEKFVKDGGGFVSVHAADNSFPEWSAYNEMIGLGGWGGRNEKSGPLLRLRDGKWTPDTRPGGGGHHGAQHEFLMVARAPQHPIMAGLPAEWLHGKDELYDSLRGPAKNVTVLASALSAKDKGGTGEDEPLLMTIDYGKGRVFHTALGHAGEAVHCVGFATTFARGTEWAATGKVTQKVPANFPTATASSANPCFPTPVKPFRCLAAFALVATLASAADPAPPAAGKRYDLSARASRIDPEAREHPEIDFTFGTDAKPLDTERAAVDTRVADQGKLVIWLMGYNAGLFDRVSGYGLHAIQVHYANGWFTKLYSGQPPKDDLFLAKVRLEAATGQDFSPAVEIPEPDGIKGRSLRFVKWLDHENPEGHWSQFLTPDGKDLVWDKVILSGISHGSTTAGRFAKYQKVDRVVMFSGPRDQFEGWQKLPSATPENRFFGFTHVLDDGWSGDHYRRSWLMMNLNAFGPLVNVDGEKPPYGHSRRLITSADVNNDPKRAHGAVAPGGSSPKDPSGKFLYEDVWRYLFTSPVAETGKAVPAEPCRMDQRKKP